MKFEQYFDFALYMRRKLSSIVDDGLAARLESSRFPNIPDDIFCLLEDSSYSYYRELQLHSGNKPFYQKLGDEHYTIEHLPALCSLNTHLAISLVNRKKTRNDVDMSVYTVLRHTVNTVIEKIMAEGTASSETIRPFIQGS